MKGYRWLLSIVLVLVLGLCGFATSVQAGVLYGDDYFLLFVGAASLEGGFDPTADGSWPESFYYRGKLAFYLEGYVLGDVFIEMLVDTDNPGLLDVVDIDPHEYYPVYGDGSVVNKDSAQHGRLYVAVRAGDSSAVYGRSQVHLQLGEFLDLHQELRGAYVDAAEDSYDLQALYGHTLSQRIREEYPDTPRLPDENRDWEKFLDITGPFHLEYVPVLGDSERIYVEVRSLRNPNRVVERRRLSPSEYQLDKATGRLEIKEFISWYDDQGRPVSLVVEYEHVEPLASSVRLHGFVGGMDVGDMWRFDAGYLRHGDKSSVTTVRAVLTPVENLKFTGQWAQDGQTQGQGGEVRARAAWGSWQAHAVLRFADEDFLGFDFRTPGQTSYGFDVSGDWDAFQLTASWDHQQGPESPDSEADAEHTEAALAGSYKHESGAGVTVRGLLEKYIERVGSQTTKEQTAQTATLETALPAGDFLIRTRNRLALEQNQLHSDGATRSILHGGELLWPRDSEEPYQVRTEFEWEQESTRGGTPLSRSTVLGAGILYDITPVVTTSLQAENRRTKDLLLSTEEKTTHYGVGVDAKLNDRWAGTVEQGLEIVSDSLGPSERAAITRAKLSGSPLDQLQLALYGRYRLLLANDDGPEPETRIGYDVSYGISDHSTVSINQEWSIKKGQTEENQMGVDWQLNPALQFGAEYRKTFEYEVEEVSYGLNATWTPNPDITVFGSLKRGFQLVEDERRERHYQAAALAYRPVYDHWLDFVGMYRREVIQDHLKRSLISLDGVLHHFEPYTLAFSWIRRDQTLHEEDASVTDFKQVGVTIALTDRWDVGGQYRSIAQTGTDNQQSLSMEVGYAVLEQLRVSAGYNFQAYDKPGFHADQYNEPGLNFGLQVVF